MQDLPTNFIIEAQYNFSPTEQKRFKPNTTSAVLASDT